jgi:hypothetical protein
MVKKAKMSSNQSRALTAGSLDLILFEIASWDI